MTASDRQVLVVDSAQGALSGVMEELDALGFRVIWVPTLPVALDFVTVSLRVSLVIVSAAAAQAQGKEFLAGVKQMRPSLRIIWGVRSDVARVHGRRSALDDVIPEPMQPDALREAVSKLLVECFYPSSIASAIEKGALEVLNTLGDYAIAGGSFLVPNPSSLSELSSIVSFSGDASGYLMVSVTQMHARALHRRMLPAALEVPIDRLEDLVGELCNQILGRINAFFAQYSIAIAQSTPIFIRSTGSTTRYAGRHPSFGVELASGPANLSLEYYLADFDKSKLLASAGEQAIGAGEVRYL